MKNRTAQFGKIAFIGNYVPRRCGIATFTTDIGCAGGTGHRMRDRGDERHG
jgi:hypothetical protein